MTYDKKYWKSLNEYQNLSESRSKKENEFAEGVAEEFGLSNLSPISRKKFLALISASTAFAVAGCNNYQDRGEIVPYSKKPEEIIPGVANFYASTCNGCSQSCGILIKTREGRPIKVDGNPDHPINQGKICSKGQASVLNLYDPYRLRTPQFGTTSGRLDELSWQTADAEVIKKLEESVKAGNEISIITHSIHSPTTKKVLDDFTGKFPGTKIYTHDLFNDENRKRAWNKCYGTTDLPVIEWGKANVILALEADFLGTDGMTVEQTRKFADGRDLMKSKEFNRLYCVEGTMSLTGANADYRLRLRPDAQLEFVLGLIDEISKKIGVINSLPESVSLKSILNKFSLDENIINYLIGDLLKNRGQSIVYAGNILSDEIHVAVNYLNEILGNTKLYQSSQTITSLTTLTEPKEFEELVRKMKSGDVGVVIHFDSNPVYHLPKEFDYERAMKSVPLTVSLVESDDETSRSANFVLPINHSFESWGDYQVRTGVYSLQQPVIAPLYNTRQKEAILLTWINGKDSYKDTIYHEYLMNRWQKELFPSLDRKADFKSFWYSSLHDGVVNYDEAAKNNYSFNKGSLPSITPMQSASEFSVALTENYFIGDGRFANNGWLQELPHPVSKIVWDNYAAISPKNAKDLNLENNDRIEIKLADRKLTLPVFLQPGQADNFISVALGYGRTNAGPIGTDVGVNGNLLLSKESISASRIFQGVVIRKVEGKHELVSTQEHHSLDDEFVKDLHHKRKIIREGSLGEYEKNPNFLHEERHELFNIAKTIEYNGVKWAMAIDLNKCTGCNVCVAGCNVENNIPVVGKEQVGKGREMQWIRVDRYYSGTNENPSLSHQPMLCQHCDNAPCENVCPVVATNHSPDGLNQMVYNRCVGTKYCSNNCPYKVRRFNFFNWRDNLADGYYEGEPISLLHNPEVTVRSRGVMEKCTFCLQRIMEARQHATEQGRALVGTDVRTACEEACPASAIIFGDMNDPNSEISKYRKHELGYHVLEEVNAKPNVTYLARLKNVNERKTA
ncbi:MAG: TAT-variant-translocated molybdopterin oxidoreductase [Ignavibacteriales bacterium]|nr:TAT-variant-translocated molybdopterin oxidoreductase [Ignavibacteriales bacterium]